MSPKLVEKKKANFRSFFLSFRSTFHFHDSVVRNLLALCLLLSLGPSLEVLLGGDDHDCFANHALERTNLALLGVRVNVRLEKQVGGKKVFSFFDQC